MSLQPYTSVQIQAMRGLSGLTLEGCGGVNLLVGGNNSGKTTVLEALILLSDPTNIGIWETASQLRRAWPLADLWYRGGLVGRLEALEWLFPHRDAAIHPIELLTSQGETQRRLHADAERIFGSPPERPLVTEEVEIEGSTVSNQMSLFAQSSSEDPGLEIRLTHGMDDKAFRMVLWERGSLRVLRQHTSVSTVAFATPISHRSDGLLAARVSRIIHEDQMAAALTLIRGIDPLVQDLIMVQPERDDGPIPARGSAATLHVRHARAGLVPVHVMGDGTRRAIHLASLLVDLPPGGVLLLDELEVGMHTSVLHGVFHWLVTACRERGVQLFATTHSLEAIDTLIQAAPGDDVVLYRLESGRVKRLAGDTLRTAREELGAEVR
jgi:energy-coupling factor transporter ATP-binding protein EcfA2